MPRNLLYILLSLLIIPQSLSAEDTTNKKLLPGRQKMIHHWFKKISRLKEISGMGFFKVLEK